MSTALAQSTSDWERPEWGPLEVLAVICVLFAPPAGVILLLLSRWRRRQKAIASALALAPFLFTLWQQLRLPGGGWSCSNAACLPLVIPIVVGIAAPFAVGVVGSLMAMIYLISTKPLPASDSAPRATQGRWIAAAGSAAVLLLALIAVPAEQVRTLATNAVSFTSYYSGLTYISGVSLVLAFAFGYKSGLSPSRGQAWFALGVVAGITIALALGFQLPASAASAGGLLAVGAAVTTGFLVYRRLPSRNRRMTYTIGASFLVLVAVAAATMGPWSLAAESPSKALVRVVDFGPGPVAVTASRVETTYRSGGAVLACGQSMLVHAPSGTSRPWRLYVDSQGPTPTWVVDTQINNANQDFELDGHTGSPLVLIGPEKSGWFERWLHRRCS